MDFMEIIFSVLFLFGFWAYYRSIDHSASNHCNKYNVDWKKVNEDQVKNNLSNSQVNKSIARGKYDAGKIKTNAEIKASHNATWEDFKKSHPNGSWN